MKLKLVFILLLLFTIAKSQNYCSKVGMSWFSQQMHLFANKTLPMITIPGTHDSGTFNLSLNIAPDHNKVVDDLLDLLKKFDIKFPLEIIRNWAKSQSLTFYEQCCSGSRYFDIRVAYDNTTSTWRTHHFLLSNPSIPSMLLDIRKFLNESTQEIVFLEFSHFSGLPTEKQEIKNLVIAFAKIINSIFSPLIYPRYDSNFSQRIYGWDTISNMLKNNQRVVVLFEEFDEIKDDQEFNFFNRDMSSYWTDTGSLTELYITQNATLGEISNNPLIYSKLQWILTADLQIIEEELTNPFYKGPKSLLDLGQIANSLLNKFVLTDNYSTSRTSTVGVFMVDNFYQSDVLDSTRIFNEGVHQGDCLDNKKYIGYCQIWVATMNLPCSDPFLKQNCKRTCKNCQPLKGTIPGQICNSNSDCFWNICHPQKKICLSDEARAIGSLCSQDYQCQSANCPFLSQQIPRVCLN